MPAAHGRLLSATLIGCILPQDFTGSAKVYPDLGEEGGVEVRAKELLAFMGPR